jgi:hypothetical protein
MNIGLKIALLVGVLAFLANHSHGQLKKSHPLTNPAYDLGRPIHFGMSLGINFMDAEVNCKRFFTTDENGKTVLLWTDVSQVSPGFNVNIISELRLNRSWSLRVLPGMSFGQRTFSFYAIAHNTGEQDSLYHKMKIESSMIEIPILFKYSAVRHSDIRPYLIGGFTPRYDLAARKRFSDGVYLGLNQLNYYVELGVGADFYLPYFKFATEIKYLRGFKDMLSNRKQEGYEYFPQSIEGIITDMVIISFNFE